jgi:cell division protein FtsQ
VLALRRSLGRVAIPRHQRRRAAVAGVGLLMLWALYTFWLRDLPLAGIDRVTITGLTTAEAPEVRRALTGAARDMTTLHVREDDLERSVSGYSAVAELEVDADFPSTLRIRVVEHRPVAVLVAGGRRAPVGGDGALLRGLPASEAVPVIRYPGALPKERLPDGAVLRAVRAAAAAPAPLRRRLESVRETRERGLVARLRRGPEIVFGDARRLSVKWAVAARVLAHPDARGASYVDVRLPDRPAVGGLPAESAEPPLAAAPPAAAATPVNPQAPVETAPIPQPIVEP